MGPRLVGRGKKLWLFGPHLQGGGFNGAASCGTRKAYDAAPSTRLSSTLQWGRVLWDAERRAGQPQALRGYSLQWGRVLWDAERSQGAQLDVPAATLQWGRVLWDAERKPADVPMEGLWQLQWGRVLWDAERSGIWPGPVPKVRRASMGPRLVGRGKTGDEWYFDPRPSGFNGAASCGTRKAMGRPIESIIGLSLQWGRVLWDAESIWAYDHGVFADLASMGPRLVGRGKDRWLLHNHKEKLCFNGAASCGTRKDQNSNKRKLCGVRFNGAASCGTRKAFICIRVPCSHYGFNGAASCGTRKAVSPAVLIVWRSWLQWGRVLWDAER